MNECMTEGVRTLALAFEDGSGGYLCTLPHGHSGLHGWNPAFAKDPSLSESKWLASVRAAILADDESKKRTTDESHNEVGTDRRVVGDISAYDNDIMGRY